MSGPHSDNRHIVFYEVGHTLSSLIVYHTHELYHPYSRLPLTTSVSGNAAKRECYTRPATTLYEFTGKRQVRCDSLAAVSQSRRIPFTVVKTVAIVNRRIPPLGFTDCGPRGLCHGYVQWAINVQMQQGPQAAAFPQVVSLFGIFRDDTIFFGGFLSHIVLQTIALKSQNNSIAVFLSKHIFIFSSKFNHSQIKNFEQFFKCKFFFTIFQNRKTKKFIKKKWVEIL